MATKARLSQSRLARPNRPIYRLAARIQDHLYFPDPSPLYAVMGALVGNMIKGNPVWLALIGGSGLGKTELLYGLLSLPNVYECGDLSGPGAFLSGVGRRERTKDATGGLLRKVGDHGALIIEDFTTSVLDLPRDDRKRVMGALRRVYNGRYNREMGTDGGTSLGWEGKVGILAGGTPNIDQQSIEAEGLGERWAYYRYPNTDGWGEARAAANKVDPMKSRIAIQEGIFQLISDMELYWGDERERRELKSIEYNRIISLASLSCKMRSGVKRDPFSREIIDAPEPGAEAPTRLTTILTQLFLGFELLGLHEDDCWRMTSKIAFDSAPQLRSSIIRMCLLADETMQGDQPISMPELRVVLKCSMGSIERAVEELWVHGLLIREGKGEKLVVWLTDWTKAEMGKQHWNGTGK